MIMFILVLNATTRSFDKVISKQTLQGIEKTFYAILDKVHKLCLPGDISNWNCLISCRYQFWYVGVKYGDLVILPELKLCIENL